MQQPFDLDSLASNLAVFTTEIWHQKCALITQQLKWQDMLGHPVVTILLVFILDFLLCFSFIKRKKITESFSFEDSLKYFIQACVARVCMKYTSCLCMLTICSYQYLIGIISMYWKVRSAWAWIKIKRIFSKKKPNDNQPQCVFKDLIDSKDKYECKMEFLDQGDWRDFLWIRILSICIFGAHP